MPDEKIEQNDIWECTAHIGAVFQDELYEMRTGRNSLGRICEFGLDFGSDRVVIYAEPNSEKLDVAANIARSGLLVRGEELPWAKWASEFRADLPQELRELMDQIVSSSETRYHRDAIKRRLLDNTVKNEDDLTGTPLLAAVGFDKMADEKPLITQIGRYAARTEAFRTIRTNLQHLRPDSPPRVIVITSALPNEGKTTSAMNLALSLSQAGSKNFY